MAIKHSATVRNAKADAVETAIGTAPKLRIYSGTTPTNITDSITGTLLVEMSLPSDWLTAASGGVKSKNGTWSGTAGNSGTATHYRLWDTAGSNAHEQGTVTATGGGGDVTIDNAVIASGQSVTVNSWSLTAGNA